MSRSWGHEVRRLTDDEYQRHERLGWNCSAGKCNEPVTHAATYSYVTGRAGRVSSSAHLVCTSHAERFAAKYEAGIIDAPVHEHASAAMLRQASGIEVEG